MRKIYNDGRLFAAYMVGRHRVNRDTWMALARERKHIESKRMCVHQARELNHELVRALHSIRPL